LETITLSSGALFLAIHVLRDPQNRRYIPKKCNLSSDDYYSVDGPLIRRASELLLSVS